MKSCTEGLLRELKEALAEIGLHDDVECFRLSEKQLASNDYSARSSAAKKITDRCHPKWLGDLNLNVQGSGSYPVYEFFDRLIDAVQSEV